MIKGLIGIDVGTGSVRGCIFDVEGKEITQVKKKSLFYVSTMVF